jgi:hypothetical protein
VVYQYPKYPGLVFFSPFARRTIDLLSALFPYILVNLIGFNDAEKLLGRKVPNTMAYFGAYSVLGVFVDPHLLSYALIAMPKTQEIDCHDPLPQRDMGIGKDSACQVIEVHLAGIAIVFEIITIPRNITNVVRLAAGAIHLLFPAYRANKIIQL